KIILGGTTITALRTAGHTEGGTTFTIPVDYGGEENLALIHPRVGAAPPGAPYSPHERNTTPPPHPPPTQAPPRPPSRRHTPPPAQHSPPSDIFLGAHGVYFNIAQQTRARSPHQPSLMDRPRRLQSRHSPHANFEAELVKQKAVAER